MSLDHKGKDVEVTNWGDAYVAFRPMLFYALGRLAKQGYIIEPAEASDLIHEFMAESWPGLSKRFNPELAKFSTYLYGAFVKFARTRIIRTQKWRASLVSPEHFDSMGANDVDDVEIRIDLSYVKQVLNRLPSETTKILKILAASNYRERKAASIMGVTRHKFRQLASEALAKFALEIDASKFVQKKDWPLAYAIWVEERSLEDAAAAIGISTVRARIVRRKILKALEGALSGFTFTRAQKEKEKKMSACDLWQKFIAHPTDEDIIAKVRKRSEELLEHIENCEECDDSSGLLYSNIGELYEALGSDFENKVSMDMDLEQYEQANIDNNIRVHEAIMSALLPALPAPLSNRLSSILPEEKFIEMFLSCEALSMLVHRYAVHNDGSNYILKNDGLYFTGNNPKANDNFFLSREDLIQEICSFTTVEYVIAGHLYDWIIETARSFPNLIVGIKAVPEGDNYIGLELIERNPNINLYSYWQPFPLIVNDYHKEFVVFEQTSIRREMSNDKMTEIPISWEIGQIMLKKE